MVAVVRVDLAPLEMGVVSPWLSLVPVWELWGSWGDLAPILSFSRMHTGFTWLVTYAPPTRQQLLLAESSGVRGWRWRDTQARPSLGRTDVRCRVEVNLGPAPPEQSVALVRELWEGGYVAQPWWSSPVVVEGVEDVWDAPARLLEHVRAAIPVTCGRVRVPTFIGPRVVGCPFRTGLSGTVSTHPPKALRVLGTESAGCPTGCYRPQPVWVACSRYVTQGGG